MTGPSHARVSILALQKLLNVKCCMRVWQWSEQFTSLSLIGWDVCKTKKNFLQWCRLL